MAPNSASIASLLRQTVYYHLDNGSWDNALFFAERLLAHDSRSYESAHLLSLSHLRLGDHRSAYEVSKPAGHRGLHLGCAHVFAQCCLVLDRFREGVYALEKAKSLWLHKSHLGKHTATARTLCPDAAVINCLLGKLCRGMDDRKKAALYFEDALRTNPLMWDAFVALCDMGVNLRVSNTFRLNEPLLRSFEPDAGSSSSGDLMDLMASLGGTLSDQHLSSKRTTAASRAAATHDMSDPFDHQPAGQPPQQTTTLRAMTAQDANKPPTVAPAGESEDVDFMARVFAARSRVAGNQQQSLPDGMATPPGTHQEPPHAPARRRGAGGLVGGLAAAAATTTVDTGFSDAQSLPVPAHAPRPPAPGAPSKIMYRLGASANRRGRQLDSANGTGGTGGTDLSAADPVSSSLLRTAVGAAANGSAAGGAGGAAAMGVLSAMPGASTAGSASAAMGVPGSLPTQPSVITASTAERKRTASGHPVAPRQNNPADETGVPQRRSARLNMFKSSSSKTNSGAAAMGGAGSTRELKKARPPISRIMRPGSSGSTVGRVVSGNRKPVDDGGMDIDPMEGPRIRETTTLQAAHQQHQQQQQQQQQQQHQQHHAPLQTQQPSQAAVLAAAQLQRQLAAEADAARVEEALRWVLELMKKLGGGYLALSQFQCGDALLSFTSLPRSQTDTPWVQAQMGRAHYEQAAYADAEVCFRRVRVLAPTRLQDMEVYSTILWFLKQETDLSFLAHELVDAAWRAPQAWCALGNAWSLAQDHEQALRCFRRATQLDGQFAYAYTLQGHEHVLNEEYDKALTAYRQAVTADRRHYNAYYGIGRVYEKLGNFDKAYEHYHTASMIHPTNAVLICCIGKVLERQKQIVPALQYFIKATDLAPRAAQTRFRKARALLAIGQLQAAQQELMVLKDLAPDEAAVHFLLGKLYKTLNDKSAAVRHFTIALSLDPKASQKIKQAIGSLEDDEDGLEEYMAL